ncbi:MAG: hypothetical protein VXV72_02340 [Bacteroidota bacterium]|nr:hypothetical protein [Bacteroidota bacterium]|tara:strand:+ start:23 stop:682 length:660 start_codon:yes stop_codon:yes gene_type:complete
MSIEVILFGVIAIILFADFLLVGIKKNKTQQDVERIGEEQYKKNKLNFNYVLSRKRNILTFILLVILTKPIIHYLFYNDQSEFVNYDIEVKHESFAPYRMYTNQNVYVIDSTKLKSNVNSNNIKASLKKLDWSQEVYANPSFVQVVTVKGDIYTKNGEQLRQSTLGENRYVFYYPIEYRDSSLSKHFKNLFESKIWIFAVSFALLGVFVLLFSDKIKAR